MMVGFPNQYVKLEKIGSGTYGIVYKVRDKKSGDVIALKKINIENQEDGIPPSAIKEISLLMEFREEKNPNIIRLLEVIHHRFDIYLAFDFCDWDLKNYSNAYFEKNPEAVGLPTALIKSIGHQIMNGVAFCHGRLVLHRDLKPSNILLRLCGAVKLADFGLARTTSIPRRSYCHEVVTLWYRPPEVMLGCSACGPSLDVWSVACILTEMFIGEILFPGDSEIDQLLRIFNRFGTPNEEVWPGLTSLPDYKHCFPNFKRKGFADLRVPTDLYPFFQGLFTYNPSERLPMRQAIRNPFFAAAPTAPLPVV